MTAPIFGLMGACAFILPDLWLSRWQPDLIALTHLYALGFILMIMCGALTQVLPVLSGKGFPMVDTSATGFHVLLTLGIVLFPLNFLSPSRFVVLLTTCLIAIPLFAMASAIIFVLLKSKSNDSILSIKFAVTCLIFTVLSGLWQLGSYHWLEASVLGKLLTNIHLSFGLLGWVTLMIIGVSFQVIPMFHVTPEYPRLIRKGLPVFHFLALLMLASGLVQQSSIVGQVMTWSALGLLHISLIGYALAGLWLLNQRRRKVSDNTVNFWRLGLGMLICAVVIFDVSLLIDHALTAQIQMLAMLVLIFGFVVSIILGMLLKIIPFLAFLHLQQMSMKSMETLGLMPSMSDMLASWPGRRLFQLYCVTLVFLLMAPFVELSSNVAGLLLGGVCVFLILIGIKVWKRYLAKEKEMMSVQSVANGHV
ncbi:hypothetical protein ACFOEK_12655 [Litoribrevibacter euphylliae]|uniref:Uncharacterized protein n=1 Tax=Litoribrevibacter euphylliae TaxID=1834034 RepID=A0ABV7HGZ0_9GAMM